MKMSAEDRFWSKVDRSGGPDACWIWKAGRRRRYGRFWDGKKYVASHRYSYELAHGPIPDEMLACHSCDNPPCCNPAHLWLGTDADNMADRDAKGRQAAGERCGSCTHPERRPRGERVNTSKLTRGQVLDIRASYAAGAETKAGLGRRFGVSDVAIGLIIRGRNWKITT